MILNGEQCLWQPAEEPYVYQNIHSLGYNCRYVAQHLEQLNNAAEALFGFGLEIDAATIERQARQLLTANHATRHSTLCVRLMLDSEGDYRLECDEATIYAGYTLRSLHPDVMCVAIIPPAPSFLSSALLSSRRLADAAARQRDAHEALITSADGTVVSDATRPMIMIDGYTATLSPTTQHCVESQLAAEACRKLGLKVRYAELTISELERADELMYVTFQGITSISGLGRHTYMHILSERIAEAMEEIFQTKNNTTKR